MKKTGALLYVTFCICLKAQISLGPTVTTFGVLAGSTVTSSGATIVDGNLGVSPGTAITGITGIAPGGPGTVINGTIHSADAVALAAQNDLTTAFTTAAGLPSNGLNPPDLGGTVVTPGVHTSSTSLGLTGTVTLDGGGNPNSIFVFQIGSTLTTASGSNVLLINGASPANVYWQVGASATLGSTSIFSGNILAQASISLGTGASLVGRALARTGAVTLLGNFLNSPGGPGAPNAQSYVYTNNDVLGPSSISAFSIGGTGALTSVAGSPFATGGTGTGGGFVAANRVAASVAGNFLYASNCGSSNVSGFSINTATGTLTAVPGSPFPTGGTCVGGGAVAVTPNNQFLYVANEVSHNISAFGIGSGGALTPLPGSPFATGGFPDGTKVSPDGKFLAVVLGFFNQLAMFSIASNGVLTPVVGSPFGAGGTGIATGVDINCASNLLFVAEAGGPTIVSVHNIASTGALSPIAGSPFTFSGINSDVVVLSPDDLHAFVSDQVGNTITALNVASGGSLTQVAGSPFANPGGSFPSGMATNQAGTFLYAANINNVVAGFSVAGSGALAPVPGSPFATGVSSVLESLVVYPPKSCVIPFAAFAARAQIAPADRAFEVDATFTLGASSDGIKPIAEAVSLTVGTFSTTIPAGSFKLNKGSFVFEGVINGVALEAKIRSLGSNRFEFKVQGERANLSGTVNPVMIVLTIGNDHGDVTVRRMD